MTTPSVESLRPDPGNDIREMGDERILLNIGFYSLVSVLTAVSALWYTTPGTWLWSIMVVGAVATAIMTVPGLIELYVRGGER